MCACHIPQLGMCSLSGSSVCLLLLADVELYSLNKLSLPAWAPPCASAQNTGEPDLAPAVHAGEMQKEITQECQGCCWAEVVPANTDKDGRRFSHLGGSQRLHGTWHLCWIFKDEQANWGRAFQAGGRAEAESGSKPIHIHMVRTCVCTLTLTLTQFHETEKSF